MQHSQSLIHDNIDFHRLEIQPKTSLLFMMPKGIKIVAMVTRSLYQDITYLFRVPPVH